MKLVITFFYLLIFPVLLGAQSDLAHADSILAHIKPTILFKQYQYASAQLDTAYQIYMEKIGDNSPQIARVWHFRGLNLFQQGKFPEAIALYNRSLRIRQSLQPTPQLDIAQSYNNLGLAYTGLAEYDSAMDCHLNALEIREKYVPESIEIAHSWANVGQILAYFMEYKPAEEYCQKALSWLKIKKADLFTISSVENNLGGMFLATNMPDSALYYFKKVERALKTMPTPEAKTILINIYTNMAHAYLNKKDTINSILMYGKAAKIAEKERLDVLLVDIYNNDAAARVTFGQLDSALVQARKSIEVSAKLGSQMGWTAARGLINTASTYNLLAKKSGLDSANDFLDSAYYYLDAAFSRLSCYRLRPSKMVLYVDSLFKQKNTLKNISCFNSILESSEIHTEFRQVFNPRIFMDACRILLEVFANHYDITNDTTVLKNASVFCMVIDQYLNYCRNQLSDSESRLLLQDYAFSFYERSIYLQGLIHNSSLGAEKTMDLAFYFSERAKAITMVQSLRALRVQNIVEVPKHLIDQEKNIRNAIAKYERAQASNTKNYNDQLNDSILIKKIELLKIQKALNKYPKYRESYQTDSVISIKEIQRRFCTESTSVLSYFAGDHKIYAFVINKSETFWVELCNGSDLLNQIKKFRNGITAPADVRDYEVQTSTMEAFDKDLVLASRWLYDSLVAKIAGLLLEEVIIIPDGPLTLVPFEALLTKDPANLERKQKWPFWILKKSISYCYSATALSEIKDRNYNPAYSKKFLGLAPFSQDSLGEGPTYYPCSKEEVQLVGNNFGDDTSLKLFNNDASIDTFLSVAQLYKVLHLSLHGESDYLSGRDAFLQFSKNGKLFIRDIFNLKLNADLVVLSACVTNVGKCRRGEGVISISRAFTIAGARGLICSLWNLDDCSNKPIMVDLYDNMVKSGIKASRSLTESKRNMIKNKDKAHPYYWSGVVFWGEDFLFEKN